ncbi:MAG: replication initiation protein [Myxococcales bacterium]|nr:replication initiation protein [Myxococcales bacterium]
MKKEVVKPSNLIHIVHNMSLLQAQLWDFILAQISPEELVAQEFHQIPISTIMRFLGNTRNSKHVKVILEEMAQISTHTLINKSGSAEWGCFQLFSSARVVDNVLHFSCDKITKDLMVDRIHYSRINLSMVRKFDCKYSLFLYELCCDYKNIGQTPHLKLGTFRQYMGVQDECYQDFSLLNYYVIKKAIEEVNEKSDLFVNPVYQTDGRKITEIKFEVLYKNGLNTSKFRRIKRAISR